jgi:hypothetical protein
MRACCILSLLRIEYDRYSSSILYLRTKVRKYESIIRKYFRTKVTYLRRYFRTLLVLYMYESTFVLYFVFPEVRRSTTLYTTYFHYVRLLLLYESTKVQLHVHVRVQLHVHVAIFTGSFINTRSYCTTRATRTCTCT